MKAWAKLTALIFLMDVASTLAVRAVASAAAPWEPLQPGEAATVWPGGIITRRRPEGHRFVERDGRPLHAAACGCWRAA